MPISVRFEQRSSNASARLAQLRAHQNLLYSPSGVEKLTTSKIATSRNTGSSIPPSGSVWQK